MPFAYLRTIHFSDTDAAGVVFFANYLSICHEAYEEALAAAGIDLKTFFSEAQVIVPIARSEAEYLRPLYPGDKLRIEAAPKALSADSFEVRFEIVRLGPKEKTAGRIRTEHVCVASPARGRLPLPPALAAWVHGG